MGSDNTNLQDTARGKRLQGNELAGSLCVCRLSRAAATKPQIHPFMGTKDEKYTRKRASIYNILNNWSLEIHKSKSQDAASRGWPLVLCVALTTNSDTVKEEPDPSSLVTRNEKW